MPLLVSGRLSELRFHVVDGSKIAPGNHDHVAHIEASNREGPTDAMGTLVAFYSTGHRGVFTHRDSDIHVHVALPDRGASGHVDGVVIEAGATVMWPDD